MKLNQAIFVVFACLCIAAPAALVHSAGKNDARDAALRQLQDATGGTVAVSKSKATDTVRFIRLQPGTSASLGLSPASTTKQKKKESLFFFRKYGAALGITDAESFRFVSTATDSLGETHLTWKQFYGKVPVFAGTIKTHFDASNLLKAVTGTAIPDIAVNPNPVWSSKSAAEVAFGSVIAERGSSDALRIGAKKLLVFREGLAQGIPGENHLAWEIEVTDGAGIRDFVYVSAHTGKVIDTITAIHDDLNRRAYDGKNLPKVPNNYPNGAYWLEGQNFPTASQEANNMIISSEETYDTFFDAFGRDSFDGEGGTMDAIFDRGYQCPNASWNGIFISFCPGYTTDDVTTHEWGHAYTQYTHNLIYEWQPGALNESYSDIWGETVDRINGRDGFGNSLTDPARTGICSSFSPPVAQFIINSPAGIAGNFPAQAAAFGPELSSTGITGDVVLVVDDNAAGGADPNDGCGNITNGSAISGKIALVKRGFCNFSDKVFRAQNVGAIAVLVANNAPTGLPPMGAGLNAELVTIPSIGITQGEGASLIANIAAPPNVTMKSSSGATDNSTRWLLGEDVDPGGAIRDMSNPNCYANPGKVTDIAYYVCNNADGGGVHTNSGVPNHAYALLVDGGTYNGQTITPIGLTKAAHIYFRAQTVYQHEASDFVDHADALESSCEDLVDTPLNSLTGGQPETISTSDCDQVTNAIAAVEMRTEPTFCNFPPLLSPAQPDLCSATTTNGAVQDIALFDFESDPTVTWTASHTSPSSSFTDRDWTWVNELPSDRAGSGFFAPDPNTGTCQPDDDQTGVLALTSPILNLPPSTNFARATFDHWFATETGFDGGNLRISVNGGPWQLVPPSQFTFNNYNAVLITADAGNSNPLAGQPAWAGTSGSVNESSWGRTYLNLGNFAGPNDSIQLRWDLGTDCASGRAGWYLDDVHVYSCTPNVPSLTIADIQVTEGNSGDTPAVFTVTLSVPTIRAVAVNFQTFDGTATHGTDFAEASGTLVIPAGATTGRITILVKGNKVLEGNETFFLQLSGAANATIGDSNAQATILNDD